MKQIRRRVSFGQYSVPFLIFIYFLIVLASYLVAVNGFSGVFSSNFFNTPRGIILLVLCPIGLLLFLSILLYTVFSASINQGVHNALRSRLFYVFCLLAFGATFPQTIIVCRYVSTALDTWYTAPVTDSLLAAGDIADLYASERLHSIEKVSDRYFSGLAISNYRSRPADWMSDIRLIDSNAASVQVYSVKGVPGKMTYLPVVEIGDSALFLPVAHLPQVTNGLFSDSETEELYRYARIVRYTNSTYVCVYTSLIPAGYKARLAIIKAASTQALVIDNLKPFLPLMGIWIYVMFSLPSFLMVIMIAWFIVSRVVEPVRSIAEAVERLAEGDSSFMIIPHSKDELSEISLVLNSVAKTRNERKKPDKKAIIRL